MNDEQVGRTYKLYTDKQSVLIYAYNIVEAEEMFREISDKKIMKAYRKRKNGKYKRLY